MDHRPASSIGDPEQHSIPPEVMKRIQALREYEILDTLSEQTYDDIVKIASEICQTPIAIITLLDINRQWFKSCYGLTGGSETPIEHSFCSHAVAEPDKVMIIQDATTDERFKNNPYVTGEPHVVFYAGVPLVTPHGIALGSLCVIDTKPANLNETQIHSLKALANQVVCQFELRKKVNELKEAEIRVKAANEAAMEEKRLRIEQFSFITSHELRHEFSKILSILQATKLNGNMKDEACEAILQIEQSATRMNVIIEKMNLKLNITTGSVRSDIASIGRLSAMEEICLVDDDPLINAINGRLIRKIIPQPSLKIFSTIDEALTYIQTNPHTKRFIFLDLNFPEKTGWHFLDAFRQLNSPCPIVILSSSIDPEDHKKADTYKEVLAFYAKPLTLDVLEMMK
jgi:CheY-like chemotaxis protein